VASRENSSGFGDKRLAHPAREGDDFQKLRFTLGGSEVMRQVATG
jgi:hypothetical protein